MAPHMLVTSQILQLSAMIVGKQLTSKYQTKLEQMMQTLLHGRFQLTTIYSIIRFIKVHSLRQETIKSRSHDCKKHASTQTYARQSFANSAVQ